MRASLTSRFLDQQRVHFVKRSLIGGIIEYGVVAVERFQLDFEETLCRTQFKSSLRSTIERCGAKTNLPLTPGRHVGARGIICCLKAAQSVTLSEYEDLVREPVNTAHISTFGGHESQVLIYKRVS
jgi:hypothetical protein